MHVHAQSSDFPGCLAYHIATLHVISPVYISKSALLKSTGLAQFPHINSHTWRWPVREHRLAIGIPASCVQGLAEIVIDGQRAGKLKPWPAHTKRESQPSNVYRSFTADQLTTFQKLAR